MGGFMMIPLPEGLNKAMIARGYNSPAQLNPKGTTRFQTKGGHSGSNAGVILPSKDVKGYTFGDHITGKWYKWSNTDTSTMNEAELAAYKKECDRLALEATLEKEEREDKVVREAWDTLDALPEPSPDHPYAVKKKIPLWILKDSGVREDVARRWLYIPIYSVDSGVLCSYQTIDYAGAKRFLKGGRTAGGYIWIAWGVDGREDGGEGPRVYDEEGQWFGELLTLILCEGFATGATIHEATGLPVCVCFNAGNLKAVAVEVRGTYPMAEIIIAGDDDRNTKGNPGRTKATEAAKAVNGRVAFPMFKKPGTGTDFNDLMMSEGAKGLEEVKRQLDPSFMALPPAIQTELTPPPPLVGIDVRDGTRDTHPLAELGNAMRLRDTHGANLFYVPDVSAWVYWHDGAWLWDAFCVVVRELAALLPDQIYREGLSHFNESDSFVNWARKSRTQKVIQNTVALLQDFKSIRLHLSLVDADPFKVGLDNAQQVLDLTTGEVRPAQREDLITKSLGVAWVGDPAKAVRWQAFLAQIFNDDAELIDWLKRRCGYLLTGSTTEHILVFCYGLGANGKSVLADILRYILGDYARAISSETLTDSKRSAGSASPDLAELVGARLTISAETEDGVALAESLVKSLVSGDCMAVRKLYTAPIQFTPQFKLMILGNHRPVIRGNDYGIWRRVQLIPFKRTFKLNERDPLLSDRLKAEAPHILAWMVEGCLDWQKRGLKDTPATIRQATLEYKADQDLVGTWLAECCGTLQGHETTSTELYVSYKAWCFDNGLRPLSNTRLGRQLGEKGFSLRRSNGKNLWVDIAVVDSVSVPTNYTQAYKDSMGFGIGE